MITIFLKFNYESQGATWLKPSFDIVSNFTPYLSHMFFPKIKFRQLNNYLIFFAST